MDVENLVEELRALRSDVRFLIYSVWAFGALLNLRVQAGSESEKPMQLNLDSPDGQKLAVDALNGFLNLAQLARDKCEKGASTFQIPPGWKM
ncbi:MAG: hypothetical protein ABSE79_08130 [Terriglobia bacterium]|jgi:hypothetical protein